MSHMVRPLAIGVAVGVGLTLAVWAIADSVGVSEDLFGVLLLVCTGIGSIVAVELDGRAQRRSQP